MFRPINPLSAINGTKDDWITDDWITDEPPISATTDLFLSGSKTIDMPEADPGNLSTQVMEDLRRLF